MSFPVYVALSIGSGVAVHAFDAARWCGLTRCFVVQVGMSGVCYPDNLIGNIPNLYYYAANNPSEATIAKRRSYANTISYLTPPAENAGLYKGLKELKELISSYQVRLL